MKVSWVRKKRRLRNVRQLLDSDSQAVECIIFVFHCECCCLCVCVCACVRARACACVCVKFSF